MPHAQAQQAKKPLDHEVYDFWNRITERAIADDGRWTLYALAPEDGDPELHVKSLTSDQAHVIPRGSDARFTEDNRFAVFMIKAAVDSVRQAKREKKKDDEMPKDSLGILNLSNGDTTRIGRVKSFKVPEEAGGFVAYLLEKEPTKQDTTQAEEGEEEQKAEGGGKEEKKKDKKDGTPLVLRNLATGEEQRFEHAMDYAFTEDGLWLVYTASTEDGTGDGIFAVETSAGTAAPVMTGEGNYKHLALDKAGEQLAFLTDRDDYAADQPAFTLYYTRLGSDAAPTALASETTSAVPDGWWVSEHGNLSFSKEGKRLFFGTAPRPEPEEEDDRLDEENVKVDIWSWSDPYLQPMQLVQQDREAKRTYRAVVHLSDGNRVVQLATEAVPDVTVGREGEGDVALGITDLPYRKLISWDWPGYYDAYVIDVNTGAQRLVLEEVQDRPDLSTGGAYVTWWDRDERAWFAVPTAGGEPVNVTAAIPHPLDNQLHDWPYAPNSYGSAGWTERDEHFLVYDEFDLWGVDPSGRQAPHSITEGQGRVRTLRFRRVDLDREEPFVDPDAPMLLAAFDLETKADGFYRDQVAGTRPPTKLVMADADFGYPAKADDADRLLLTRETFQDFPDLWVSDLNLTRLQRVSEANPWQDDYRWGTVELVTWTSLDGLPLKGLLYKPEDFDPSQQYPMMVYFYEKNSDNLHAHHAPATARASINYAFYVSRGYLLFVPDIPYKVGYPGESAVNAILPGVTMLIDKGFVDRERIGVQGHSWGGYQAAYLVTESNLFAAAEAGAPVSNMTSAYGGIRWGSGMSRMFQYENTQSRIGGSLWEKPLRYIENSPLFYADKIETPLLMLHNDDDGAVPWYQGIELFVALRRLDKPVWMFNYNGEPHGLTKYPNKRDWAIRMQQFFDHYLLDAPAPEWMIEGVPALEKGKTLGLEPVAPASDK